MGKAEREIDNFQMLFAVRQTKILLWVNICECIYQKCIVYANMTGRAQTSPADILKVPQMHRFALS